MTGVSAAAGTIVGVDVGGTGEWTTSDLDNLRATPFSSGAALAIDTTDGSFTYPSAIGGTLAVTKLGPNTLTVTGNSSTTGLITIAAGTLQLGNGGTSGYIGENGILNNGTLVFNRSDSTGFGRPISGPGNVVFAGTGQVTIANPTTYTGGTTVNPGSSVFLYVNAPPPNYVNTAPIVGPATNNGTLTYYVDNDNHGNGITSVPISGSGVLIKDGSGDFYGNNASTYSGGTTLLAGTLHPGISLGNTSGPLTVNGGTVLLGFSTLQIGALNGSAGLITPSTSSFSTLFTITVGTGDGNGSYGGSIQDSGPSFNRFPVGLTKVGLGTQMLTGSNTYTHGTQISGGILQAKFPGSLPNLGSVSIAGGATMAVNVGGANEWATSNLDSLRTSAAFNPGSALGIDTSDGDFTYGSNFGGSFGLTKLGANTLTLLGTVSYTGPTLVAAGTLLIPHSASLNGLLTVNSGATFLATSGVVSFNGGISNIGTIRIEHGAVLSVPIGSSFINSGLLDVITGSFTQPTGFVNNGIVLDSRVVKAKSFTKSGGTFSVAIDGYSGHTYQLQRGNSPTGASFTNAGPPQNGATGGVLTFNDQSPDPTRGFYRVQVDP